MPWKLENPLVEAMREANKLSEAMRETNKLSDFVTSIHKAQDALMRSLGYVWVDEPSGKSTPIPKSPAPLPIPTPKESRKELVKRLWKGTKADLYRKARVEKSRYYAWERGELKDGCAEDERIRRVLLHTSG